VGLENTRRRLQQLYGADHQLDIESTMNDDTGTTVTIEIPYRTAANTP
jgi:sensor histidine kinase YesM